MKGEKVSGHGNKGQEEPEGRRPLALTPRAAGASPVPSQVEAAKPQWLKAFTQN